MKFSILYESKRRMRIHVIKQRMNFVEADTLLYWLKNLKGVKEATVHHRTCNVIIKFSGDREVLLKELSGFHFDTTKVPKELIKNSGRALNAEFEEKLVMKIVGRYAKKLFLPMPVRMVLITLNSLKFLKEGLSSLFRGRLDVAVLDAAAIGVSVVKRDFKTAGSVMFLLGIGGLLEEWTHKRAVGDLARTMSLNVSKVWIRNEETDVLVNYDEVKTGDRVVVTMGSVIPFDGVVVSGEAMVNQASMTGESVPVKKDEGSSVFAGTVIEEGELVIQVKTAGGKSRYEKIVAMIEETEKLKGGVESKAEKLADHLVPYTLFGTGLVYLLTRNIRKALSVLMVDFSCALKLAMPVSVLSAIREAGSYGIMVKGGKFIEAVAEADTIVFDKTGTLTKAKPTLTKIISFNGESEEEILRIAACLEEHFPHSIANAVVHAAVERGIDHEEMHTKVNYIVAHGISTTIGGKKAVIGSEHFVFEDEKIVVPEETKHKMEELPEGESYLYLAIDGRLVGILCIADPVREEAKEVIERLRELGISKVVMMTGDNERTAKVIAKKVGVDKYYSQVLPEDKARFVEKEKELGRKVIMIGDGINDSPALSAADCGIAISDGAEIAREIADITISGKSLRELVYLKKISNSLMGRIGKNYRRIVGVNGSLILLGLFGILPPTGAALFHNTTTLFVGIDSMSNLIEEEKKK